MMTDYESAVDDRSTNAGYVVLYLNNHIYNNKDFTFSKKTLKRNSNFFSCKLQTVSFSLKRLRAFISFTVLKAVLYSTYLNPCAPCGFISIKYHTEYLIQD